MYERQHFTNSRSYVLLFNHSLKITDPNVFMFFSSLHTIMINQNVFTKHCMKFWKRRQRGLFCGSIKVFKEHKFGFQDIISQMLILELLLSSQSRFEDEIRRSRFHRRFSPWTSSVHVGFLIQR